MAVFARSSPHGGQVVNAGQVAAAPPPPDPVAGAWARALFEGVDDPVFVPDLEGPIFEANPPPCPRPRPHRRGAPPPTTPPPPPPPPAPPPPPPPPPPAQH